MAREVAREWFVPAEGIDRNVISTNIQSFLGRDATVRPGMGTLENAGVQGYWIKAYRNLTNAMIDDLRILSARWNRERNATGNADTRESYVASTTFRQSNDANRGSGPPPQSDMPRTPDYGVPHQGRERGPASRMPMNGMPGNRMEIHPQQVPPSNVRYGGNPFPDNGSYQQDPSMPPGFGNRPPESSTYRQNPGYPPQYGQQQPPNEGPPPGYRGPASYYPSGGPEYDGPSAMPNRPEPPYGMMGNFGQQPPSGRDPRYPPPEYDPRHAYPSPAATISQPREPVTSPAQQSSYRPPQPLQYDQYGRTVPSVQPAAYAQPPREQAPRNPNYERDRQAPIAQSNERDARRR